jgi:hypothetical protein
LDSRGGGCLPHGYDRNSACDSVCVERHLSVAEWRG